MFKKTLSLMNSFGSVSDVTDPEKPPPDFENDEQEEIDEDNIENLYKCFHPYDPLKEESEKMAESGCYLKINEGDIIHVIEKNDNGYWRGKLKGNQGLFPSKVVKKLENKESAGVGFCAALKDYKAKKGDEIDLEEGDIIKIIRKIDQSKFWFGEVYGNRGMSNYNI